MDEIWLGFRLLLLIAVANGAPVVAKWLLHPRWSVSLDGGACFLDGRRLLGPSKTVRGAIAGIAATALMAPVLGIPFVLGALMGAAAMTGDALSSFIKRRLGIKPSGEALVLDQIPESLLPLLAVQASLGLSVPLITATTLLFLALEIPLARASSRLRMRDSSH
jgi:CDP-2,3-bis-(O-geranylgeranyl)-sn-glycerol synthase